MWFWNGGLFVKNFKTEIEVILNSLYIAKTMIGKDGHKIEKLPVKEVLKIINTNKIKGVN